jgi:uncharacterized membrane protein
VPSAFQVNLHNLGPSADTYSLSVSNLPSSFTHLDTGARVTVPAGQTGILGLYLQPTGQLPAPGTQVTINVTATSTTNPSITQTQTVTFTVPAIDAIALTGKPTTVNTPPGVQTTDTLTLSNVGNVQESITLSSTTFPGLTLTGLAPVTLSLGQSKTETIMLTPDPSTPLNSSLSSTITATFGPSAMPVMQTLALPVNVVVPGADAIASAGAAAKQVGETNLANRLTDLSIALTNLVQDATNRVASSQALAALDAVMGLFGADPFLAPLTSALTADRAALAQATMAAQVQAAVSQLGTDLSSLAQTLTDEAAHNFTLSFVNNSQVGQPNTPTTYQLVLQNTGNQTTTYDLSLSGLPAGVTSSLSRSSITLTPGQVTPGSSGVPDLTVTLTSTSTTQLAPFSFTVQATAEGAPEITQTATGQFTARAAVVQVVEVTATPPFTNPGGLVDITAKLLNAVNRQQQAQVSYTVTDPNGKVVFTSQPVATTLDVLTTLTTVDLGKLDTTNFALGQYTITVNVADAGGHAILGATGTGSLLIGSPVSASLAVTPDTLPAGNGTVTSTLQLAAETSLATPLSLAGQLGISGASSVAADGTLAYVGTGTAINIVDISNPAKPALVSTFGTADLPSGASATYLQVTGNELVVLPGKSGQTSLLICSLANPSTPTLLGQTLLTFNSGNDSFLGGFTIVNNHVYTTSVWYRFNTFSKQIFAQFGESLVVDISNPAAPAVVAAIYNNPPDPSTGFPDGTSNTWQVAAVNDHTLLVGSTTATGSNVNGQGVILVVDTTNPASPSRLGTLMVPGMGVVTGIVVQGNRAFVIGSTQTFQDGVSGLAGNVVTATLDLTNPQQPVVLTTQTLNVPSIGMAELYSLGNNLYVTDSFAGPNKTPQLLVFDASDPTNIGVSQVMVPNNVSGYGFLVSGNHLFTADGSNLFIYNIGQPQETTVTAQVTVPTNNGVAIVPNSFNVAPTKITTGPSSETLEWDLAFTSSFTSQTLTWQSSVTGLQPGEARTVAQGATVHFVSQGTPGTLNLPAQSVTGDQIIGLGPATQTAVPGAAAAYTITLTNPSNQAVTYNLSVQGVPASWVNLAASVPVGPNASVNLPLTLTADSFAATGDDGFTVTATDAAGATGSVQGDLVLQGKPTPPDSKSHGIVLSLIPATATAGQGTSAQYVVQLTNTGSADDTFTLAATGLPSGVTATFGQTSLDMPPGTSNFRDVALILTPPPGTTAGSIPFTITAASTTKASVTGTASGTLSVQSIGVGVMLSPASGAPGSAFQLTVTNTGQVTDTFDLALAAPGALAAPLGTNQVMLAPGASQTVSVTTQAIMFAVPGPLALAVVATSHTNPAVQAEATAAVTVPPTQGLTAQLAPPSQTLPQPGTATFLLQVQNSGNTEDAYTATITGTTGPITAALTGLDGNTTETIPVFRLPGLTTGVIQVQTSLSALGTGTVQIQVRSLSPGGSSTTVTATLAATASPPPSHPPAGDSPLSLSLAGLTTLEGQTIDQQVATLTDSDLTASTFSATIDWGDGTTSAGTVAPVSGSPGTYVVHGQHTYSDEGSFTVRVTATDTGNGQDIGGSTATASTKSTVEEALLPDGTRGTANQRFIAEVYHDILGRPVDASGLATWTGLLDAGLSRFLVVLGIENTSEYRLHEVQGLYQRYLHRDADPLGMTVYTAFLADGGTVEQVATFLVRSAEYAQLHGIQNNDTFLDALYADTFHRAVDAVGRAAWDSAFAQGVSRAAVASALFASAEYRQDLVEGFYQQVLDRELDASGRATWVGLADSGSSDDVVLAAIIGEGGAEYFQKTA